MQFLSVDKTKATAVVTLARGKVNALSEAAVDELAETFQELAQDTTIRAVVLTGAGKFFSFGFDIPGFMDYPASDFGRFLQKFSSLYNRLYLSPKPLIAAINGHCIAGGCMLTNACDYRVMVDSGAKISLNEVTFGATVFAGSVEILRHLVGSKYAEEILLCGRMYGPQDALRIGLVDELAEASVLLNRALIVAEENYGYDATAFAQIKSLLRKPIADRYAPCEQPSIERFVEIWYAPAMRERLRQITIHS
ncbi:MAG: enoyl-CoA hydratase/isomerase family protein [bacterium]